MTTVFTAPDLIIFGGSFDPPHIGHRLVVEACQSRFPNAKIMVFPSMAAAKAGGGSKSSSASFEDRVGMTRLLFANTHAEVCQLEAELPTPNYTFQLIQELRTRYPQKRLALLMGQDQFASFDRWHRPLEMLKICDLVVVRRTDDALEAATLLDSGTKILRSLSAMHSISSQKDGIDLTDFGTKIYFVAESVSDAQSSMIRKQIEVQGNVNMQFMTEDVASYIQNRKLYAR
jgi:nicotinate-nucleotide adenylyltransferase